MVGKYFMRLINKLVTILCYPFYLLFGSNLPDGFQKQISEFKSRRMNSGLLVYIAVRTRGVSLETIAWSHGFTIPAGWKEIDQIPLTSNIQKALGELLRILGRPYSDYLNCGISGQMINSRFIIPTLRIT